MRYAQDLTSYLVSTIDSANFIKIVYPSDKKLQSVVKEFYVDGSPKFVGQYDYSLRGSWGILNGDCISFFKNGKRESVTRYTYGHKIDFEYLFYPDGKIYCSKKYAKNNDLPINWECYDKKGIKICDKGNGSWILYDTGFEPVLAGPIVNGLFEGEWHGETAQPEFIKYVYQYHKGKFRSGAGYDQAGKAYSFSDFLEKSSVLTKPFRFLERLRNHFKIPQGMDLKKKQFDDATVSFILEKDGSFSDAKMVGRNEPEIASILKTALAECGPETPRKYYGIPMRTRITMSFKEIIESSMYSTLYKIATWEEFLDGSKPNQ